MGRFGVARADAVPCFRLPVARNASVTAPVELPRVELPHLRPSPRPARRLDLQPRRVEAFAVIAARLSYGLPYRHAHIRAHERSFALASNGGTFGARYRGDGAPRPALE